MEALILYLLSLALVLTVLILVPPGKIFYLTIASVFTTEFLWIHLGGGIFRISYFLSLLTLAGFLLFHLKKTLPFLARSRLLLYMLLFLAYNLSIILLKAPDKARSLFSFGLFIIMVSFTFNFYLFLKTYRDEASMLRWLAAFSLMAVLFGLLQFSALIFWGKALAFTPSQKANILLDKRITSFFTEADTFGKNLMVVVLLLLPFAYGVRKGGDKTRREFRWSHLSLTLYLLVLALNATRSAMAGLLAGLLILVSSVLRNRKAQAVLLKIARNFFVIFALISVTVSLAGHSSLITRRVSSLFHIRHTIRRDSSASVRYKSIMTSLRKFTHSGPVNILLGSGWTTITTEFGETRLEGTPNIFVTILVYSGVFGTFLFLLVLFRAFRVLYVKYKRENSPLALGALASLAGALVASQMAPMMLAPEFWMLFGISAYLEKGR